MKVLILAGGSGSRLWPLSRKYYSKQFLKIIKDKSLLQLTFERVKDYETYIITTYGNDLLVKEDLKRYSNFKSENIIIEPIGKNTGPAIAYAATLFSEDEVLVVLPSDHFIEDVETFKKKLMEAEELAQKDYIVTFGIKPTEPHTGYGYIKIREEKTSYFKVDSFKEKPPKETAEKYIKEGNYYWNSGMFVFKVKTILKEMSKYSPRIVEVLEKIKTQKNVKEAYKLFPDISIDYAVMEKTDKIVLLPLDNIGWSDVGSFSSLHEMLEKNDRKNSISEGLRLYEIESENNIIICEGFNKKVVSLIGVNNLVVAETEDALLVADKERSQQVKEVYSKINAENREEALYHKKVIRPWGYYKSVIEECGYKIKEIVVYPGGRLSLQSHTHRSESWTVVKGNALVVIGDKEFILEEGQNILIPKGEKHRLSNPGKSDLIVVEVQMGEYLGEDDIIRYEDDYNRS